MSRAHLTAILWDFDGTLADTRYKNLRVTRSLIERVTGRPAEQFPGLQSFDAYASTMQRVTNWRSLYRDEFGLTEQETDAAAALWASYQLADETVPRFFDGITDVLTRLSDLPHGIVSQNARAYITAALSQQDLGSHFAHIVGYEEVGFDRQKPAPDGLLQCLETLTGNAPGTAIYIGDHETDIQCAANATEELQRRSIDLTITSVAVAYGGDGTAAHWRCQPDYRAVTARDIIGIARSLQ